MVKERVAHYITPNHSILKPVRHLFFDVETAQIPIDKKRTEQRLKMGWCMYWRRPAPPAKETIKWYYFDTIPQFWAFALGCTSPKEPLYMASHNLNFDFSVLKGFDYLSKQGWELISAYNKGSTSIIRFEDLKKKLVCVDNQNWWKCSLKNLGDLVGLPKLDVDPLTAVDSDLYTYCKRDVEIIYKAWCLWYDFMDEHDLGKWSFTLPAQSMAAYRHRFMPCKLLVHADVDALTLEREAYRGGRSSVFRKGEFAGEPFYKVDINSAYPYAMKNNPMPIQLYELYQSPTMAMVLNWLEKYLVIARVQLDTDDNPYPVQYNGHNVYPTGRFETTLTTPEILLALEHGWIKKVLKCAVYKKELIFTEYVDYFYNLKAKYKDDNNPVFYRLAKLLLNGNYGKWGQLSTSFEKWVESSDMWDNVTHAIDQLSGKPFRVYHFGDWIYREIDEGESNNSMPAIAAHITAYVRLYLFKLINMAGKRHTYLCDTDSLIVNQAGFDNLQTMLHDSDLGMLKLEGVSNTLVTKAPKNYQFGDTWTRKAIPPKAVQTVPDTWEFTKFLSIRGLASQPKGTPYYTETTSRTLQYRIFDGKPDRQGWIVPLQADKLDLKRSLPEQIEIQLEEISMQMDALRETRTLPPTLIFSLWDFRLATWKKQRSKTGQLVPFYLAHADELATEYGFTDTESLQKAVTDQLATDDRIRELKAKRQTVLYNAVINRDPQTLFV